MPFTEEHYASIALAIARKVHALRVPAHKVLVLDCDETLWRGVVGEDGINGITMPPALIRLQQFAIKVQAQGTLVCLVSKNAERDVLEVFEKRPEMALRTRARRSAPDQLGIEAAQYSRVGSRSESRAGFVRIHR